MPCNCARPDPKYPTNLEWGPAFWGILHTLAHHAGGVGTSTVLQADERKHWTDIFVELSDTLPCEDCKQHYRDWLGGQDLARWKSGPYAGFGDDLRRTWWGLHNEVNARLGKPVFAWEGLPATYTGNSLRALIKGVSPTIDRAIRMNGVRILPWKRFLKSVQFLMGIYGCS
jgi:hypothetical protein